MKVEFIKDATHHSRGKTIKKGTIAEFSNEVAKKYVKDGHARNIGSDFKLNEEEKEAIKEAKTKTN